MKFEEIQQEWDVDSTIDRFDIGTEALKIPKLHSKYYRIYVNESIRLKNVDAAYKALYLEKYEFFTLGHSDKSLQLGWKLPPQGRILKNEVSIYLDADIDLSDANLKVTTQKEKVKFLESILKELSTRNFHLRVAVDYEKFRAGV